MTRTKESVQPLDDPLYTLPIYRRSEAARLVGVRPNTLRNWAKGYVIKRPSGMVTVSDPLVTTAPAVNGSGPSVPFVGLAESYVLAAFRAAGVPMQRIRPAIQQLETQIGLDQVLASKRLYTDGAEVLWDYGQQSDDPQEQQAVGELVVVRNGQGVFREVVQNYLTRVTYEEGWAKIIYLPQYSQVDVIVDPSINGGTPTLARRGIRLTDIVDRRQAGDTVEELAYDYELTKVEINAVLQQAA